MNWLCKIFGHKWFFSVKREDEPKIGYVTVRNTPMKACIRCGEPNPNYETFSKNEIGQKETT